MSGKPEREFDKGKGKSLMGDDRESIKEIFVMATMDCEPVRSDIPENLQEISKSGPVNRQASEQSIRGCVGICASYGLPVTLFLHPEVAAYHTQLLLDYENKGHCLGLHLHPYKLTTTRYHCDLGAYSAAEQQQMISEAADRWQETIGHHPLFFRAGYFSANDMTYGVLEDFGFIGGSVSIPGRVLPEHQSVWVGAADFPHRANTSFRFLPGESSFVEVPVSVDYRRPIEHGAAGEVGYEWPYIASHEYDFDAVVSDIVERFRRDKPQFPVLVMDVHNDQAFEDPQHPASRNLHAILDTLFKRTQHQAISVKAVTLHELCASVGQVEYGERL